MKKRTDILPENMAVLFDELQQECFTAVRYIEALKVKELSKAQREDILGELSNYLLVFCWTILRKLDSFMISKFP